MWIVSWNPFLMKKLLKSDICGSHEQYTRPIDVIKKRKSKKNVATIHWTVTAISCCSWQKKKKEAENATHKRTAGFSAIQTGTICHFHQLQEVEIIKLFTKGFLFIYLFFIFSFPYKLNCLEFCYYFFFELMNIFLYSFYSDICIRRYWT